MPLSRRDLWDTNHVKQQLLDNSLPEWKLFAYFLAITTFDWLQFSAFRLDPVAVTPGLRFEIWSAFAITICGVIYLFFCNGGPRGVDFLRRYFPLSVVVGIKFVIASYLLYWLHDHVLVPNLILFNEHTLLILFITINLAMFLRIGFHLRQLSKAII